MIEHIVLFRFKPDADTARIIQELRALKTEIPSILDLTAGANFSPRSKTYEHALVVRFADREGLDAYQVHPAHQRVVQEWIRPSLDDIIAVDYEY